MSISGAADGRSPVPETETVTVPVDARDVDRLRPGDSHPTAEDPDLEPSADAHETPGGWVVRLVVPVTISAFAAAFALNVWDMGLNAVMPLACACLLAPLAALSGWSDWRSPREGRSRPVAPAFGARLAHEHRPVLATLACCIGLALLLPVLGGLISTAVFAVVLAAALGERRPWVLGALAAGVLIAEFLVFQELLGVDLPAPIWAE